MPKITPRLIDDGVYAVDHRKLRSSPNFYTM